MPAKIDFERGNILLLGEFRRPEVQQVQSALRRFTAQALPVQFYVDSPGGSALGALQIALTIAAHGRVDGWIGSQACNAAAVIALACPVRIANVADCHIELHGATPYADDDLRDEARIVDQQTVALISESTGLDCGLVFRWLTGPSPRVFGAIEAKELGLIHAVHDPDESQSPACAFNQTLVRAIDQASRLITTI